MLLLALAACSTTPTTPERDPYDPQAYDCWTEGVEPETVCGTYFGGPARAAMLMTNRRPGTWHCRISTLGYCENMPPRYPLRSP